MQIEFKKFKLSNGLRFIVHEDHTTPMAVLNVLYDVGARDEDPSKTGFAHLFEHLMFGGSINIKDFEGPLLMAGGENNAFTTNDLTNYYIQLPAENIETACWLESDRMISLAFSEKSLDVQRKVVCEEFKEHYINRPYGDVAFKMRELAYKQHPYRWMTIGQELSHIENAKLSDVKAFFHKHYNPSNAILVMAGNIQTDQALALAEKWFGNIPAGEKYIRHLPIEPKQEAARIREVKADVPLDALYKSFHVGSRTDPSYYAMDLIGELLGGGGSSRLFQKLVKEKKLFSNIECYHFGSSDPGLLLIEGKLIKGTPMTAANQAIREELDKLCSSTIDEKELIKVKNKTESAILFEDMSLMNRASNLAMYELMGDVGYMNTELNKYLEVTAGNIRDLSASILDEKNSSSLFYYSNN
jgi:predicted Zn-dependent peptidase